MSATRKPWLTRRRVIAGAVLLVLVLVVAGMLGLFDPGAAQKPVKVEFVDFEKSGDGKSQSAVVIVKSAATFVEFPVAMNSSGQVEEPVRFVLQFRSYSTTGAVIWNPDKSASKLLQFMPGNFVEEITTLQLPQDGRTGRVEVCYSVLVSSQPALVSRVAGLFGMSYGMTRQAGCAASEQEIQCPLLRPDGTVEPPRLLRKGERKKP